MIAENVKVPRRLDETFISHPTRSLDHPVRNLVKLFAAWKLLLLLVAACSPSPGYDTSTELALSSLGDGKPLPPVLHYMAQKLTRWDGIYFVTISNRGYMWEQEWAFGWGFTRLIALFTDGLITIGVTHYEGLEAVVAMLIAHVAHLFAVLLLFKLTCTVLTRSLPNVAFTAAALHIIAPAGIFLSAPYAESCCAFLTCAGCLNFTKSFSRTGQRTFIHDLLIMLSGVMFGAATTFRSNGIFNGLLLLEEAFRVLFSLRNDFRVATIRRLIATGLGGIFVGAGFVLPQYVAYNEYCIGSEEARPWCDGTLPSIYTFVQDYYWNVGPFRYWTVSNLPLFLLAAPMFAILFISGLWGLSFDPAKLDEAGEKKTLNKEGFPVLRNLAISQLLLTLLTLTTAHMQIITRISSACPVWLWYAAASFQKASNGVMKPMIYFMVMYSFIQAGLYASFLPPA